VRLFFLFSPKKAKYGFFERHAHYIEYRAYKFQLKCKQLLYFYSVSYFFCRGSKDEEMC